jgi:Family of unknown function (DUF5357)
MKAVLQDIRNTLQPQRWDSWQTLMLMAIFSAGLGVFATDLAQIIISSCGWIWLVLSVWWLVYEYKKQITLGFWFPGPWIVGAMIALFMSSNFPIIPKSALLILWAPVSAAIAILPNFIQSNSVSKQPEWAKPMLHKRQGILLLVLTHLLIACWVQFYFLLQNWLTAYPSLRAENLGRGNFIVNIQPEAKNRGKDILKLSEAALRDELKDKSWPEVERWLLETNRSMAKLQDEVQIRLGQQPIRFPEDNWWRLNGKVTGGEYDLELQAYLQRPSSQRPGRNVTMLCRINPTTITLPPEKIAIRTEDVNLREVAKNLPRFKTIAKIKCEAPSDPSERPSEAQVQDDATTGI